MAIQKKTGAGASAGRAAAPSSNMVSLKPSDQSQGGILDDTDVTFSAMEFIEYDYDGKADHPVLALHVVMNDGENDHEQYFSAGSLERFRPSEDGTYIERVEGVQAKGLATSSNAAIFLASIVAAGFPEDKISGTVTPFIGINAHVIRVPQPNRKGLAVPQEGEREKTVLTVATINRMPWDKPGAKTAAKPAATAAGKKAAPAPAPVEADDDVSEEAANTLAAILEAKGGSVLRTGIAAASFKILQGNPNRAAILKQLADEDFLGTPDMGWEYDGKTITTVS
jgi:hypothetical protein